MIAAAVADAGITAVAVRHAADADHRYIRAVSQLRVSFQVVFFVLASCGGTSSSSDGANFAGTWLCPVDDAGDALTFVISASGSGLMETFSIPEGTGGSITCNEKFTVSGRIATLDANQTMCTLPPGTNLEATPFFATQTVAGNVLTYTGADEGGPPSTVTCTRQ